MTDSAGASESVWRRRFALALMVVGSAVALMGVVALVVPVKTDSTPRVRCSGITVTAVFTDRPKVVQGESCRHAAGGLLVGGAIFMSFGTAGALAGRSWSRRYRRPVVDDPPIDGSTFPFPKLLVGRRRAVAVVGSRDLVVQGLPVLRGSLVVSLDRMAAVVALPSSAPDREPLWSRDVRRLDLVAWWLHPSTVVIVFREPLRVGPFKFGAGQELGITRHERMGGVDVDVLGVGVADPTGFSQALAAAGVPVSASVAEEVAKVVRVADGLEADARLRTVKRRRLVATARMAIVGLAWVCAVAAQLGLRDDGSGSAGAAAVITSSLIWMALTTAAGLLVMIWARHRTRRAGTPTWQWSPASTSAVRLGAVAGAIAVPLLVVWLTSAAGLSPTVTSGAIAGIPGGMLLAVSLNIWL